MKIRNLPKASRSMIGLLALASMPVMAASDADQTADEKKSSKDAAAVLPEVSVSGQAEKVEPTFVEKYKIPNTVESITKEEINERVNLLDSADAVKYEPSIFIRKRYVGDNNSTIQTRTATPSQSARTMLYADGVLLSNYLDNSNSLNQATPRWNLVAPNEIESVDVLYGPFSAQYSGNALGGVIDIKTKMPKKFEAYADAQASLQDYSLYGHSGTYSTQQYSAGVGDRYKDLSFRFDYNHLDSISQPVGYSTNATRRAGAVPALSNYGVSSYVYGETQLYHTIQDNFKWKVAYDFTPTLKGHYVFGLWENNQFGNVNPFLTNASGAQTYTNFSSYPNLQKQSTWSHGLNLHTETGGKFDWELKASILNLEQDTSGSPTSFTNNIGTLSALNGTNSHDVDAKGIWRPGEFLGKHEVSFGFHHDQYQLVNPQYSNINYQGDLDQAGKTVKSYSAGTANTEAYWAQDSWDFHKDWNFNFGGRLESWSASNGINQSIVSNALQTVNQPNSHDLNFSPKAKLTWFPVEKLKLGAAIAKAYRYPTVGELYRTYTNTSANPNVLTTSNPNLKPENALTSEISAEYFLNKGKVRLSFFQEQVENAIYSTYTTMSNGTYASTISNVGQTDAYGIEFSGEKSDIGIDGLDLMGSATWTDARITNNSAADKAMYDGRNATGGCASSLGTNPHACDPTTGKFTPRIPEWRATLGLTYHFTDNFSTSVNGRYSSSSFSQLNNSDTQHFAMTGNSSYLVADLKMNYKLTKQLTFLAGIDNINNNEYIIYHPFPQRTYVGQLKFNY